MLLSCEICRVTALYDRVYGVDLLFEHIAFRLTGHAYPNWVKHSQLGWQPAGVTGRGGNKLPVPGKCYGVKLSLVTVTHLVDCICHVDVQNVSWMCHPVTFM